MRVTAFCLIGTLLLCGCSGIETIPDDTQRFEATGYRDYAWRSEPLPPTGSARDRVGEADPIIREAIEKRMRDLGYRPVAREDAEFLIEYMAAAGFNEGLLSRSGTNVGRSTLGTINRLPDGATVDNAYALSGVVETGNLMVAFVDQNGDLLWSVRISAVTENVNRVDAENVRRAVRKGLAVLPPAPR